MGASRVAISQSNLNWSRARNWASEVLRPELLVLVRQRQLLQ